MQRRLQASGAPAPAQRAQWQGVSLGEAAPEDLEAALASTILGEFEKRLERIGVRYQTPARP